MKTIKNYHGKEVGIPDNWNPQPLITHTVRPVKKPSFRQWLIEIKKHTLLQTETQTQIIYQL